MIAPDLAGGGALADRVRAATEGALASGALAPIRTRVEAVDDRGWRFELRVVEALRRKPRPADPAADPFENPEPALVVAELPPDHRLLLNKFPVFPDHLLVVTRAFAPQEVLPDAADFAAALAAMAALPGEALAFHNGGRTAGASQPHRHLQLVPGYRAPLDSAWAPWAEAGRNPEAGFVHALAPATGDPAELRARAAALLRRVGRDPARPGPFNLLWTRRWVLVVPRRRESHAGISINALGFAGSLLARDAAEARRLRDAGPRAVLAGVAG